MQRCSWGARGGGQAASESPGCPCSWLHCGDSVFHTGSPSAPPEAAAWGQVQPVRARFWQTPVLLAVRVLTGVQRDSVGGVGWREEGQLLGEPGHPPRWSGDAERRWFFHQGIREGAAARVCQTLRSLGTTTWHA